MVQIIQFGKLAVGKLIYFPFLLELQPEEFPYFSVSELGLVCTGHLMNISGSMSGSSYSRFEDFPVVFKKGIAGITLEFSHRNHYEQLVKKTVSDLFVVR